MDCIRILIFIRLNSVFTLVIKGNIKIQLLNLVYSSVKQINIYSQKIVFYVRLNAKGVLLELMLIV